MKKTIVICFIFCLFGAGAQNVKALLEADSAVWFGLDFSKAKFTGSFAQAFGIDPNNGSELVNKWIPEWNSLVLKEPLNFDIGLAIKKPWLHSDIKSVTKINSKIAKDSVYSEVPMGYKIQKPELVIPEMLKNYSSEEKKSGLGCVLIVESFNKAAHTAYIYFVLFDIETKKLIGYKRLMGVPKGFGLRNFWAGAIKDVINQIRTSAYPSLAWNATKSK